MTGMGRHISRHSTKLRGPMRSMCLIAISAFEEGPTSNLTVPVRNRQKSIGNFTKAISRTTRYPLPCANLGWANGLLTKTYL